MEIAEALMLEEGTVSRHVEEYLEQKKLKPENGGSTSKLNEEQSCDLIKHLESQIDSTATESHFKKLRGKYPKAGTLHLILDQGPYNKSQETQRAADKYGITLHYLPPYSPNLNSIERL